MGCCGFSTSGGAPSGSGGGSLVASSYELDFSALPDIDPLGAGPHAIDGLNWNAVAPAGQLWRILNGQGLAFDLNGSATNTAWTNTSQTAAGLEIDQLQIADRMGVGTLAAVTQALAFWDIEIFCSTLTLSLSNNVRVGAYQSSGTPASSASRIVAASRLFTGGQQVFQAVGASAGPNMNPAPSNTFGVLLGPGGARATAHAATWAGQWPEEHEFAMDANYVGTGPILAPQTNFFVACASGSTAGNPMIVIIERMRFRAWRLV